MTTLTYARKWRPQTFSSLAGQEHINRTLRQAVLRNRVAQSFLFCGPRGTGKTTTARILAKAINCLDPQEGDPCDQCRICQSIQDGRCFDIVEMDAASNRGVNDVREMCDKVHFLPAECRKKVYIIDEAHMLTTEASNAFLKTLEEPPAHVVFILCTTEVQAILKTIVSRCQRYDFTRLSPQVVSGQLHSIAVAEGLNVTPDALQLIGRNCEGSLRDAENILEQLAVRNEAQISVAVVENLLGLGRSGVYLQLARQLISQEVPAALNLINEAVWEGAEPRQMKRQTLEFLRAAVKISWGADDAANLPADEIAQLRQTVQQATPQHVLRAARIWAEADLRYDAPNAMPLELAVAQIGQAEPEILVSEVAPPGERPTTSPRTPRRTSNSQPVSPLAEGLQQRWSQILETLKRAKGNRYTLGALLRDCPNEGINILKDEHKLVARCQHVQNFNRLQEELADEGVCKLIEDAIEESFGIRYSFEVRFDQDLRTKPHRQPVEENHLIKAALGLGGKVISTTDNLQ